MLLSWPKVLQNVNDFRTKTMSYKCVVGGCDHKSWVHKTLKFHSFPKDERIKRKWISAVRMNRTSYKWHASHRVCSAHLHGRHMYESSNILAIFPRGAIFFRTADCYLTLLLTLLEGELFWKHPKSAKRNHCSFYAILQFGNFRCCPVLSSDSYGLFTLFQ